MSYLCISVTFLDGTYHGRGNRGEPEWPPSPLRLFQAMVAAASVGGNGPLSSGVEQALNWLAGRPNPVIVAPSHRFGQAYRLSVPNNAMDIVASAWCRGNETSKDANPATHRAMKTVRPTHLIDGNRVFCLWRIDDNPSAETLGHVERLAAMARRVVALGWGIDLVAGHGEILSEGDIDRLPGERWSASVGGTYTLRVPTSGTLRALTDRHAMFLRRLDQNRLAPVAALSGSAFGQVAYARDWQPSPRPIAALQLLKLDASGFRPFDALQSVAIAGMLRHAASRAAEQSGWTRDRINSFVLGHGESKRGAAHEPVGPARFAYVPLPSIERRGKGGTAAVVTAVRRAIVTVLSDGPHHEIDWARRMLSGCELVSEQGSRPKALVSLAPESDRGIRPYLRPSSVWATVTPVVLPGRDDRRSRKTEALLRKAIVQAGFSQMLARCAQLEWHHVGFRPGTDLATRYFAPKHLQTYPRYHVRLTWRHPNGEPIDVPGPIVIGGGRYGGLGTFAAAE